MKKLTVGVLCAGVVAAAGVLATSYYSGIKIQEAFEQNAQAWSAEDGFSVEVLEYERGWIRSHAKTLWSFAGEEEFHEIQVTHDMLHGPWPMGKAAKVISRFLLPESSEPQLVDALQSRAPLEWTTIANWSGQTTHTLASPQFAATFQDGSTLVWGGLQAQWDLSAERNHAKGFMRMPELRVQVEDGSVMDVDNAEFTFDTAIPEGHGFWVGPTTLNIGAMDVQDTESQTYLKLQKLAAQAGNTLQEGLLQSSLGLQLAQLQTQAYNVNNVALNMQLKHVNALWFDQFIHWMQAGSDIQNMPWLNSLPQLLAGKPEISVSELTMGSEDGPISLSARLAYVGTEPEAFNPLGDLEGQLQTEMPMSALAMMLESKVRNDYLELLEQMNHDLEEAELQAAVEDGLEKRLDTLLGQGVFIVEEMQAKAALSFSGGELKLNGQPIALQNLLSIGGALQ